MSTETASFTRRRDVSLVGWQIVYTQRSFWRNRRAAMFTIVFPLMFLLVFGLLNDGTIDTRGGMSFIDFYVPGIIAYAIILSCFNGSALNFSAFKADGTLKRLRTTPLPWPVYVLGQIGSTLLATATSVAIMLAVGTLLLDANFYPGTLPGLLVTLALGCVCFTTLGVSASRLIAKPENGIGIITLITLPLSFISNIFFPLDDAPTWLQDVAGAFPLKPLADGLQTCFDPRTTGSGFNGHDLAVLAIWTVVGGAIMLDTMRSMVRQA